MATPSDSAVHHKLGSRSRAIYQFLMSQSFDHFWVLCGISRRLVRVRTYRSIGSSRRSRLVEWRRVNDVSEFERKRWRFRCVCSAGHARIRAIAKSLDPRWEWWRFLSQRSWNGPWVPLCTASGDRKRGACFTTPTALCTLASLVRSRFKSVRDAPDHVIPLIELEFLSIDLSSEA